MRELCMPVTFAAAIGTELAISVLDAALFGSSHMAKAEGSGEPVIIWTKTSLAYWSLLKSDLSVISKF